MNPLETLAHSLPPSRGLHTEFDCCEPVGQTVQAYKWTSPEKVGPSRPVFQQFSLKLYNCVWAQKLERWGYQADKFYAIFS